MALRGGRGSKLRAVAFLFFLCKQIKRLWWFLFVFDEEPTMEGDGGQRCRRLKTRASFGLLEEEMLREFQKYWWCFR